MSASPADGTPGRTPNGGVAPIMRRPKKVDPLVRPKPRKPAQAQRTPATNGVPSLQPNGLRAPSSGQPHALPQHPNRPPYAASGPFQPTSNSENISSGFSAPPLAPYHDYPLVLSKKALMEGFRHHVARFSSKKMVDPRNSEEFVRPVRLHRRDPRAPPAGGGGVKNEDQLMGGLDDMDEKERERQDLLKAERDAQREADMAQVAPAASATGHRKMGHNMKKTEQIWRNDQTDEQKAQSKLRYEEALPWHLEDFDNKSTWVGTYEAALSDTYGVMYIGQDNVFRMIPLEKWYKFTQKNLFKTFTIEEAEIHLAKKTTDPRWLMDLEKRKEDEEKNLRTRREGRKLFIGRTENDGGGGGDAAPVPKGDPDIDDIDFQEDRFADDEENMVFEEDDETKEAEERIKKDQLKANVFDLKPEKEYEKQEELEKQEKEEQKAFGKRVKKALMKREKNYNYDDDSSDNPYSSESESESTETERLKEEERKKAEESKSSPEKDKLKVKNSGSSSKGTNTPSHRPSKHSDPLKHSASSNNLKRPGSPLNSEASGNESTRKKLKKKHPLTSQPQSQANNTLQPPSRPDSPALALPASQPTLSRKSSNNPAKRHRGGGSGSGSDSEGGAGSGGEMSDGTRRRVRLKLGMPSKNGTPQGSRSGSPEVHNATAIVPPTKSGRVNSRAGSPVSAVPEDSVPFPTGADIRAVVPATGLRMSELLAHFKGQINGDERKARFIKLMKENTRFEKVRKVLLPLENP